MELHPLVPDLPVLQARGQARAVSRGPRTVAEILEDGRKAMELEDAYCDWLAGRPVKQLRRPRRTLRQWLFGRQPEPVAAVVVSEVVPIVPVELRRQG